MIIGKLNTKVNNRKNINIGTNIDPNNPSIVLLGLIVSHNLVLPKNLPTKYPDVSEIVISDIRNNRYKFMFELTAENRRYVLLSIIDVADVLPIDINRNQALIMINRPTKDD
tara:strand:- start:273 stop:608 length:336 start_codon:yes stop_codon:yes gene_type:complete